MLNELCKELNNWFEKLVIVGDIRIADGKIKNPKFLSVIQENQYFRIIGSVFNDGVYQYTDELNLVDEEYHGGLWTMAIPKDVIDLATDIKNWCDKYAGVDSVAMSPFNSESFGGYSYSKSTGGSSSGGVDAPSSWQSVFANRLKHWRKL